VPSFHRSAMRRTKLVSLRSRPIHKLHPLVPISLCSLRNSYVWSVGSGMVEGLNHPM